jgi:peptide/nickel transport system substrate-binding protein
MLRNKRSIAITAIAISVALGASACGGSGSGSSKATKGGTLMYYAPSDFDHLDPQRTYTTQGENIGREIYRSLTGWDQKVGQAKPTLAGDLATDTGTPSDNAKTWTFHIRPNVKWQDGSTVTSQDVKYGVERSFSPDINGGPQYAAQWLIGGDKYKGPYTGKSLDSIETPDAHTIVFKLKQPVVDFNQATAMETFAAVPQKHDTKSTYDTSVWSDGPYMLKSYQHNKELVLVKNPKWTQASDPLRNQNVNEIDVVMGKDQAAVDQLMKADGPNAQNAIIEDPIAGTDLTPFSNDPAIKSRLHHIPSPGINYLALNVQSIKNIKVRQAIEFAMNKDTVRGAFGGSVYGPIANTMLAPGVDGHQDFNLYSTNTAGDVAKAKALMAQAGNPKLSLSLAVESTPTQQQVGTAIKSALARIGITVNISQIQRSSYFSTLDNVNNHYDLAWMDWIPDWPNASTVLPILFDGRQMKANPQSNQDISRLNVPAINSKMDQIGMMSNAAQANAAYGALDKEIMQQASVVPLVDMTFTEMQGSKVGGLTDDSVLAEMNLAHVFVKS